MNANSPLFPVFCLVLALVAAIQLIVHLVKAVSSVSAFLISACAKIDLDGIKAGVYAI